MYVLLNWRVSLQSFLRMWAPMYLKYCMRCKWCNRLNQKCWDVFSAVCGGNDRRECMNCTVLYLFSVLCCFFFGVRQDCSWHFPAWKPNPPPQLPLSYTLHRPRPVCVCVHNASVLYSSDYQPGVFVPCGEPLQLSGERFWSAIRVWDKK